MSITFAGRGTGTAIYGRQEVLAPLLLLLFLRLLNVLLFLVLSLAAAPSPLLHSSPTPFCVFVFGHACAVGMT